MAEVFANSEDPVQTPRFGSALFANFLVWGSPDYNWLIFSLLYARLKNGTYYVTGYGVRPSVRKLFRFRLTLPTVYIRSS